jgi:hypothetical protein
VKYAAILYLLEQCVWRLISRVAPGNQKILSGGNLYLILIYKERVAAQKVPKRKNKQ